MSVTDLELEKALHGLAVEKDPINPEFVAVEQVCNPTLQIDWITAKIPFFVKGRLNGGNIINTTPEGEIEYAIDKRLPVTGSYESKLTVRSCDYLPNGDTYLIQLSGNPVKWFQGHNIFGTDDLPNLIYETVVRLSEVLNCPQPDSIFKSIRQGLYSLSRVDITGMFSLPSRSDVYAWLKHGERTCRTRTGTAISKGSSLYFNRSSARWEAVIYSKGQEIEKHKIHRSLDGYGLDSYADNKLRVELRLKGKELSKIGLKQGSAWLRLDPWSVYHEYIGRIEMSEQVIREKDLFNLPPKLRSTYKLWTIGVDVRQFLSKATFYRHRKELADFGVDISVPRVELKEGEQQVDVVPLKRVLELKHAGVPEWAYGTKLMFEPRRLCG